MSDVTSNVIDTDPELIAHRKLCAAKDIVVEQLARIAELRAERAADTLCVADSIELENTLLAGYRRAADQRTNALRNVLGVRKGRK